MKISKCMFIYDAIPLIYANSVMSITTHYSHCHGAIISPTITTIGSGRSPS